MRNMWRMACLSLLGGALLFSTLLWVQATEEVREIKLGYVANYGTVQTPAVNGAEGYGYEYFQEVLKYMDGKNSITIVPCQSWTQGLTMLESGEIDVLGPTFSLDFEDLIYSQSDFGECQMLLATLDTAEVYYGDYTAIDGATIGIPLYYADTEELVEEFLDKQGITADLVDVTSADISAALESQAVDYVLVSSLQTQFGLQVVARLDSADAYYVVDESQRELMDEINQAMDALENHEYRYQMELYNKYSKYTATAKSYISQEEYALLQEKGVYTVGVRNFESPLSREGIDGELEGVSFDVMDALAELAGVTFEYIYLDTEASQEMYDQADMLFVATTNTGKYGFNYESDSYLELPFLLLENTDLLTVGQEVETVGVVDYYQISANSTDGTLYGRTIVEYTSIENLQKAFTSGEVDSIILTIAAKNMLQETLEGVDYISETLDMNLNVNIAFSDRVDVAEIAVFNKLISHLDQTIVDGSVIAYSVPLVDNNLVIYLWTHPVIIVIFLMVLVVVIIIVGRRRRRQLSRILNIDRITGLMTEHKFVTEVKKALEERSGPFRIVTLDVDSFQYINEIYGYDVGTELLKIIGNRIKMNVWEGSLVARTSGDNFLIFAPVEETVVVFSHIEEEIESIRQGLRNIIGKYYKVYFSFGMYDITDTTVDVPIMVDYANMARQQGKGKRETTIHLFTERMRAERTSNNEFTSIMEQALVDEEFVLFYQPKIDMKTERPVGAEVLVRWQRASERMPPYHFIPLFEKNGFIEQMDYYVLAKSCVFLKTHKEFVGECLSVNLSGVTMLQDGVVQNIKDIAEAHGVEPSRLDLEITETAFVEDGSVLEKVQALRQYGFTISMDDFGAGVSSLNRLKNIQVDTLKIDREFIIDAIENPRGRKILHHVIKMSRDLNLETVAEGIETEEQRALLGDLGCDVGQGYYYARPMPEHEFIRYCKRLSEGT